jgi:subtilisin family serine protease
MIDTGITLAHPALAGARIQAEALRGLGRAPSAGTHGTAVAALLVGAPDGPLPGLLPGAELFAVDAFHRGQGGDVADAFDLAGALDQLVARRVAVINLSFAGPDNAVLEAATRAAAARGVVLTAAAGNGGPQAARAFPAAYGWVIAVTAVDRGAQPYVRAVQGAHLDFAAPGVGLLAPGGGRGLSGTSFAVPFVTAAYALALPREPAAAATRRLTRGAQDLGTPEPDAVFGHGLIQPQAAWPN